MKKNILKVGPRDHKTILRIEKALRWASEDDLVFTIEDRSHHSTQRGVKYDRFTIAWETRTDRETDLDVLFPHLQTLWPNLKRGALLPG